MVKENWRDVLPIKPNPQEKGKQVDGKASLKEKLRNTMPDEREHKLVELGTTRSGMQPNIVAALAYVFTVLTGPIVLMIEKENKYVRFHAMQAILYGAAWIFLWIIFGIAVNEIRFVPAVVWIIDTMLHFVIMLGGLVLLLFLIYRTYKGERVKLPIIGEIAEKIVK